MEAEEDQVDGGTKEYLVFSFFFYRSLVFVVKKIIPLGKLRMKFSLVPFYSTEFEDCSRSFLLRYNLSILRSVSLRLQLLMENGVEERERGWKLFLEPLTPLLGIVKDVPFTHESGNFDKTSTRGVYVR